jgi:hypothetical protein
MIEALRRVPYFAALPDAQIQQIARHVRTQSYETGEVILVEGRPCEGLYFVIRGHVRLWHAGPDGREQVLRVLGPGRPFNDVAVFDEGANPDNVTAAGPCVVGLIPTTVVSGPYAGRKSSGGRERGAPTARCTPTLFGPYRRRALHAATSWPGWRVSCSAVLGAMSIL